MTGASPTMADRLPAIGGLVVLALSIATVAVSSYNRGLQETVSTGQAKLAKGQAAANLDNMLIRLLTSAAVEHNDGDIKDLLAANGVTYRQSAAGNAAAAPAVTQESGK